MKNNNNILLLCLYTIVYKSNTLSTILCSKKIDKYIYWYNILFMNIII